MNDMKQKSSPKPEAATAQSPVIMTMQTEEAIAMAKAAFEQGATASHVAIERALKTVDAITGMSRGNVDALLQSSRIASGGLQTIAQDVADFTRSNLDKTTAAAQELTRAKTAPELMTLQSEFAKNQFNTAISEVTRLSEAMYKMMADIFEPLQRQALIAAQITDLMKED